MRILVLLNRIPYPLNDGGAIGAFYFVKGYLDVGCEVYCLAMNTTKHHISLSDTDGLFDRVKEFVTVDVDNTIKPIDALINLASSESYVLARFKSDKYKEELIRLLTANRFDVVHVDGLPPCLYIDIIRKNSVAKVIMRAHNVEYKIWERAAEADINPLKRAYLGIQARRLKAFEKEALAKVDLVLAISKEDESFLQELQPSARSIIVPAGRDIDENKPIRSSSEVSLFFIGALDWLPNIQGLEWFINEVWPQIHEAFPYLLFHVAGKKMPSHFYDLNSVNIIAHGEVPSSVDFMDKYTVLLSPLVSGSGVRIKIIEAMAMGKVVLSTSVSAEGSGAEDGKNILIADTAAEFISQLRKLLNDGDLLKVIASNAREYALENFQNKRIMTRLVAHYNQLCS